MGARALAAALARPRLVIATWLVVLLAIAAGGLPRLAIDFSSKAFFSDSAGLAGAAAEHRERWGPDDDVVLAVVRGGSAAEVDRALQDAATKIRAAPGVLHVVSPLEMPIPGLAQRVGLRSDDGRGAALVIKLDTSSDDLLAVVKSISQVREAVESPEVVLAGVPAVRAAFFELVLRDQMRLVPLTFGLVGFVLLVAYRRIHVVALALLAGGVPLMALVCVMGIFGEPIGLLSQVYFTAIPVLAMAECIHVVESVHESLRDDAGEHQAAVARGTLAVAPACAVASFTTAAGFLSLSMASMPVLRGFGIFAAVGVLAIFAVNMTLVPALFALRRVEPARPFAAQALGNFAARLGAYRGHAVVAAVVVTAGAAYVARDVPVDNRLHDLLRPEHPVSVAGAYVDEALGGSLAVDVEIMGNAGQFSSADSWRAIAAAEDELRGREDVGAVVGPGLYLFAGEAAGVSPQMARASATGLGLAALVTPDGSATRMTVRLADRGGRAMLATVTALEEAVARHFPDTTVRAVGTTRLAYAGINRVTGELQGSFALAFVVIFATIGFALRSLRMALISVVPNILPLLVGYAAVGAITGALDPLGISILILALGISVDDTVHILARYQRLRRTLPPTEARRQTYATAGRALTLTTLALTLGLSVNLLSAFPPLALLGLLATTTLLTAYLTDLLLGTVLSF